MKKEFTTWTFAGVAYLAAPSRQGVHIADEFGKNFGLWMSVESFRDRQRNRGEWSALGSALIQIVPSSGEGEG